MIIVSQDKQTIVNYNTICLLSVDEKTEKIICSKTINDDMQVLGTYGTKERAKEVLQEIIKYYKDTNYEYENCWCLRNLVYEMPTE